MLELIEHPLHIGCRIECDAIASPNRDASSSPGLSDVSPQEARCVRGLDGGVLDLRPIEILRIGLVNELPEHSLFVRGERVGELT